MSEYPVTIADLEAELLKHSRTGRSDALFRYAIAVSQLGSLGMHLTHDPVLNPVARPYGTIDGEVSDAGHAIVQLLTYVRLRNISLQEAINVALDNLRDKDFIARPELSSLPRIRGDIAYPGVIESIAFVDPFCEHMNEMPAGHVLVAKHPTSGLSQYVKKIIGIVTDHGGISCHAAIIAREFKIPCIVGTASATHRIRTGDRIKFFADTGWGTVEVIA